MNLLAALREHLEGSESISSSRSAASFFSCFVSKFISWAYGGDLVPREDTITCLGVVLDRRMTMSMHIDHLSKKATKSLGLLRYAAGQRVRQKSLMNLLRATVSSRIEYGLHLGTCASKTMMDKLQRVLNAAMQIVTGAAKPTLYSFLIDWCLLGVTDIWWRILA